MTTNPYEVPAEMRDFAEKSVEQAKKAFEGYMEATLKVVNLVEGASESTGSNLRNASTKVVGLVEKNIETALEHAQKLIKAKDVHEMMMLQSEFIASQIKAAQEQAKEFEGLIHKK